MIFLILGCLLEVVADCLFKVRVYIPGFILYGVGTFFWAYSFRVTEFTTAVVVFNVLNVVLDVICGVLLFKDQLSGLQILGVFMGLASIAMVSI